MKRKYYEQNKEQLQEYKKEYYEEHADHFKEYEKQYRVEHAEQIKEQKNKLWLSQGQCDPPGGRFLIPNPI